MATESLWRAWSFQPLVIGGGIVAVLFFLHGWRRLRGRRAGLVGWRRIPLFVGGVLIVVLAIVSPLDAIGERYLQWAHMLQHVLIADAGVVLILLGVRGPLSVFFLPRTLLAPLARMRPLRRALSFLLRPGVSYAVWLSVLVAWHVPPVYEAALENRLAHDLEHMSFVLGGILVWTQLVDPSRHQRLSVDARLGYAALVYWTGQILAYVLVFSFEPLFSTYEEQPVRLLGLSALTDQKLAGLTMMVEQTVTVGLCFLLLLRASRRQRAGRPTSVAGRQPAA